MIKVFGLLTVLIFGSSAFAEADLNPNIFNVQPTTTTQPTATSGSGTRETPVSNTPTRPVTTPVSNTGSSINPGAIAGQQSQSSGAGTNAAVGGALMAAGAALMSNPPTVAPGAALMAMGILAMMQSGHDAGAAGESGLTSDFSNTNGGGSGTNPVDSTGTGGFVDDKIKEGIAKLGEAGYKMNEKGLTGPDGSFIPAKAFDSPASMAAAGIDPSAIAQSQQLLDQMGGAGAVGAGALDGAKVSGVGLNTGGGGGGGGGSDGVSEGDGGMDSAFGGGARNPFDMNADKKAALVAGKTVMFDGEPIGVRGQNIFDMVHSCYQKKRAGKHFIESEHDVATRAPASAKPRAK